MNNYHNEDTNAVISYNNELWSRFLNACEHSLRRTGKPERSIKELSQSLDLLRAVNSFRAYPRPKDLFSVYPELAEQSQYVELLWSHFNGLTNEELSNLATDMIHEICGGTE